MNTDFKVVTGLREIAELNKRLAQALKKTLRFQQTREITYPAGHSPETVFFQSKTGKNVRALAHYVQNGKLGNFLLNGDPESDDWMEIGVQLNFPSEKYNRRLAGAFLVDQNGHHFLAHRGKLTKGKSGLQKAKVLRKFSSQTVEAEDNGQTSELILICNLDAPDLVIRLWEFAQDARGVATKIATASESSMESKGAYKTGANRFQHNPSMKLSDYFDEYAGSGKFKGNSGGDIVVEHGDIVKALEAHCHRDGKSQKSQAIDLAVVGDIFVDLYEVKTSARTTDLYTGVGQLLIHGECIYESLRLKVRRHLVLPEMPHSMYSKHIMGKAGINIVTFTKSGSAFQFHGLD